MKIVSLSDPNLYANVNVTPKGVVVQFCRRYTWINKGPTQRLIEAASFQQPYHVVLDKVYDLLNTK